MAKAAPVGLEDRVAKADRAEGKKDRTAEETGFLGRRDQKESVAMMARPAPMVTTATRVLTRTSKLLRLHSRRTPSSPKNKFDGTEGEVHLFCNLPSLRIVL